MAAYEKTGRTRRKIVEATSALLYRKGFCDMSFSDIAEASKVPRGNLYYYFKTKDDILDAVIEHRLAKMRIMLDEWDRTLPTPLGRLERYVQIPIIESRDVIRFGCPMGSLNTELGKHQRGLQRIARRQFDLFKVWIAKQFREMNPRSDAEDLAIQLLMRTQGLAVLAHAYRDKDLIAKQVGETQAWIAGLSSR